MKKPELNDFKREVHDGADMADWYQEYYQALENYTEHIESERKQLIDALREAQKAIETLPENALGIAELSQGIVWYNRDDILQQIKQALRNAGVEG